MSDKPLSRVWLRTKLFHWFSRNMRQSPSRGKKSIPRQISKILVLAPVQRGDYIVLSPLIRALSSVLPRTEISVVVTNPGFDIAKYDPFVKQVFHYQKLPGWFKSIKQISEYRPDVVILPKGHPATTEAILLVVTKAKIRVGLSHPDHNKLLTHTIEHHWDDEHRSEAFARILAPFGIDPTYVSRRLHIGRNPEAEGWAEDKMRGIQSPVTINISATQESRRWTSVKWKKLLERLHGIYPSMNFIALGAPDDWGQLQDLGKSFPYVKAIRTKTFLHASALIARSSLLISVDTGIVQAAAARNVPIVGLYNGDHEVYTRFEPQSVPHAAILAPKDSPIAVIDPEMVTKKVVQLVEELNRIR